MKKYFIVLFLFISTSLFSQVNLDSLWNTWNDHSRNDTIRLSALGKYISEGLVSSDTDSALVLAEVGHKYALEKGSRLNVADMIYIKAMVSYMKGDFEQSTKYFKEAQVIFYELNDKKRNAGVLGNLGLIYRQYGELDNALKYYGQSLLVAEELNNQEYISKLLNNIGVVYYTRGDYANAIQYYHRSLRVYEDLGDLNNSGSSLANIASVYYIQGNDSLAIDYYNRSLIYYKEINDIHGIGSVLIDLGTIYDESGEHKKAKELYEQALNKFEELDYKSGIARVLNYLGDFELVDENFTKALTLINQSISIREEINDKPGLSDSYSLLGQYYSKTGNPQRAVPYLKKALALSQEVENINVTRSTANRLYQVYKSLKDESAALEMYELYIVTKDSIDSEENKKEVIRQEYKYEYEKEALADNIIQVEKQKVQEAILEKSRIKQRALLAGLILFIGFSGLLFYRFRISQRQKSTILQQNSEIQKLSHAVDQSPVSVMITNLKGEIDYVNPQFTKATGFTSDEVIGEKSVSINTGFHNKEFYKNLWETILAGDTWTGEFCNKRKDGEIFWEAATITGIKDSNGEITQFIAIKEDITEKKKATEELDLLNQLVYGSLESADIGAWWIDFNEEDTIHALDTTGKLLGLPIKKSNDNIYTTNEWRNILIKTGELNPEYKKITENTFEQFIGTISGKYETYQASYPVLQLDGSIRWILARADVPKRRKDGTALLMTGTIIDITELKNSEKELKRIYELSDNALDLTKAGFWKINYDDAEYYYSSERAAAIFGEKPNNEYKYHLTDEWYSRIEAADPEIAKATGSHYQDAVDGKVEKYDVIYPYVRPVDGKTVWIRAIGYIERDEKGKALTMNGVAQDITQSRER